jgi:MSHA pilin protein MshA
MKVKSFAKKQSGFTLIELVVVIVILGILAVVALPRFSDMSSSARTAAVKGMEGAVRSAATIAHAQALATNQTGATGSVTMEGQTVNTVWGYPDATVNGIPKALNDPDNNGFDTSTAGQIQFKGTGTGATTVPNCRVNYTAATSTTAPTIGTTVSGC